MMDKNRKADRYQDIIIVSRHTYFTYCIHLIVSYRITLYIPIHSVLGAQKVSMLFLLFQLILSFYISFGLRIIQILCYSNDYEDFSKLTQECLFTLLSLFCLVACLIMFTVQPFNLIVFEAMSSNNVILTMI